MRYGELFAGAGGLSLGLDRAGMECAFHAEIEPFPRRVLAHRWPDTPLYGDVTTLDGAKLIAECGPIDLLSGGSPCQDLSVAGKRKGMTEGSGTRSSLFFEQVRLYHETNAEYLLWENVDGARSSNNGKDFACVLSALVGGTVLVPGDGWRSAGVAVGAAGIAAWRVLDAQFFGVPQRRRRVFVLCSRTGRVDPAEVLLEREGVRRDSAKGRGQRQDAAASTGNGVEAEGGVRIFEWHNQDSRLRESDVAAALNQNADGREGNLLLTGAVPLQEIGKRTGASTTDVRAGIGIGAEGDPMFTLQAQAQHGVFDLTGGDSQRVRVYAADGIAPCLQSEEGRGHGVPSVLAFDWQSGGDVRHNVSDRHTSALQASQTPAVCITGESTHALTHEGHDASEDGTGRGTPLVVSINNDSRARATVHASPLRSGQRAQASVFAGIPRRLLPIECERLMGWPDNWTDVPDESGKPASDSARYRACGNGVVSHQSEWIGRRLLTVTAQSLSEDAA